MSTGARIKGGEELKRRLRNFARLYPERVGEALYFEAQIMLTEMKRRTPVKTGRLRASGVVDKPRIGGKRISVQFSFNTPYAVYVHENLEAHHEVGQAKFAESVVRETQPHLAGRIAKRVHLDKIQGV